MENAKPSRSGPPRSYRALAAVLLLLSAACSRSDPEQRLRDALAGMQEAVEQREVGEAMEHVAEDFSGNGMDRAALHNLLRAQVLANARIGATLGPARVEVQGSTATVKFSAVLTGGQGRLLPDRAQAYEVTSGWREADGEWRLYYAQWTPRM